MFHCMYLILVFFRKIGFSGKPKYCNSCFYKRIERTAGCSYGAKRKIVNKSIYGHNVKWVKNEKNTCEKLNAKNKCPYYWAYSNIF